MDNDPTPTSISLSLRHGTNYIEDSRGEDNNFPTSLIATIDGPSTLPRPVTVTVSVGQSGDSATAGVDYRASGTVITIPAGSDRATIPFTFVTYHDNRDEPEETFTVSGSISDLTVNSITVSILDNDSRGVTVSETALSLKEADDPASSGKENEESYTVVLTSQPTGNVTVTPSSGAATVARVEPSPLTFTPANWETAQTVTVLAVDNAVDNPDDVRSATITHGVSGADYDAQQPDRMGDGGRESVSAGNATWC